MRIPLHRQVVYAAVLSGAGLGLLEGGARLLASAPANARYAHVARLDAGLGFEALNATLIPNDRLFWSLRPAMPPTVIAGRVGPQDELRFTASTTASGWRTTPPAPDATRTLVAAGDSCTFGIGVDDDQTFPAALQRLLPGVRCINAGVPGYSAFQGRRMLEANLDVWRPVAVTIAFGFNDAADWDGRSDREHADLVATGLGPFERSRLVQLGRHLLATLRPRDPPPSATRQPRLTTVEFAEELRAIIRLCREVGATPILIAWPARYEIDGRATIPHHDVVRAVAKSDGVALVDPLAAFRARGGAALFADVIHANAAGNRAMAELVRQALAPVLGAGG